MAFDLFLTILCAPKIVQKLTAPQNEFPVRSLTQAEQNGQEKCVIQKGKEGPKGLFVGLILAAHNFD
jgi:hypothetical protein